jgi:type VI secretion system secreted protein Hcp
MAYKLTDVMVSSYSISSGGDRPMESLSLNFTKIEFKATQRDKANKGAGGASVTYDLAKAKVV